MKTQLSHYLIETPEVCLSWIGGPAQPDGDHVWLVTPDGKRVLRVPRSYVTQTTPEETALRILADRRALTAERN